MSPDLAHAVDSENLRPDAFGFWRQIIILLRTSTAQRRITALSRMDVVGRRCGGITRQIGSTLWT